MWSAASERSDEDVPECVLQPQLVYGRSLTVVPHRGLNAAWTQITWEFLNWTLQCHQLNFCFVFVTYCCNSVWKFNRKFTRNVGADWFALSHSGVLFSKLGPESHRPVVLFLRQLRKIPKIGSRPFPSVSLPVHNSLIAISLNGMELWATGSVVKWTVRDV